MNDHIDPDKLRKAREWVEKDFVTEAHFHAAAEVIANLPDQIIDADKVREWMDNFIQEERTGTPHEWLADAFTSLQNTFLTPKPRTLADMTEDERAKCQWMQAEHRDKRCIIIRIHGYGSQPTVSLLTATGATIWTSTDKVIPLPDLPRLVWPDEPHPEPAEEPSTPEVDPKVLLTEEDYREAPDGTICAGGMGLPFHTSTRAWRSTSGIRHDHRDLSGTPRRVLRWGMGEQA